MSNSNIYLTSPCNMASAYSKCARYMRKIFKFDQMDFQFAMWQMFYLFVNPQKLIKLFRARKQAKSQYARDDPAFLVLFAGALSITTIAFSIVLQLSFFQFIQNLLFVIFVDCIGVGVVIATFLWYITNTFLKPKTNPEDVEWGFCFDIHLNAFFPPLILLHFIQLFFYNGIISHNWMISIVLGNTFWLCSCLYYFYITFLGYNSLQMLNNTRYFLLPVPWIVCFYVISLLMHWNITHKVINFYRHMYM
ncbi:protein unc-50 homolog [Diabrotica virgifera virgifera]|uniref:Protein unc-50 homolog n=1 Tax=Diabrotica virgifera virgifera TaxID=50390 RepID=A0A6P7GZL5_DIAVI|nr:protein unc-50 homolog [Diabrotica virgifera virgifera]